MSPIRGILFDFDGTLTVPGALDFNRIRRMIGCPSGVPILEYIESLPEHEARLRAHQVLLDMELEAARQSYPNEGAETVIHACRQAGLALGILTRNARLAVDVALANFHAVVADDFRVILSRDDDIAPKPDPAGVHLAAERMDLTAGNLLVVGDYRFDIEAGNRAGAATAFLTNGQPDLAASVRPTYVIHRLAELLAAVGL